MPEGCFWMGSTDEESKSAYQLRKEYAPKTPKYWFDAEKPRHRVWVDAFYVDKHEVTVGEYKTFRRVTGYHKKLPPKVSQYAPTDRHPVVLVSWADAKAYCRSVDKALPTEAQWEKAARGSDGWQYPWGDEKINSTRANYCDAQCELDWKDRSNQDGYPYTAPVGTYERGKSP